MEDGYMYIKGENLVRCWGKLKPPRKHCGTLLKYDKFDCLSKKFEQSLTTKETISDPDDFILRKANLKKLVYYDHVICYFA